MILKRRNQSDQGQLFMTGLPHTRLVQADTKTCGLKVRMNRHLIRTQLLLMQVIANLAGHPMCRAHVRVAERKVVRLAIKRHAHMIEHWLAVTGTVEERAM